MLLKTIQDAYKMLEAYKLKFTYRWTDRPIENGEKESVAAHSWAMMLVADYLLERLEKLAPGKYDLDREKIYSMIAYHDLLEAEIGDFDLNPVLGQSHDIKAQVEHEALQKFPQKLPAEISKRYLRLLEEYETRETLESKFVKIVDIVECQFLIIDKPQIFTNFSRDYFIEKRRSHFEKIPEFFPIYEEILDYYTQNNYFDNSNS